MNDTTPRTSVARALAMGAPLEDAIRMADTSREAPRALRDTPRTISSARPAQLAPRPSALRGRVAAVLSLGGSVEAAILMAGRA